MTFDELLKEKNKRLDSVPLAMQTALERQQSKILKQLIAEMSTLTTVDGKIEITPQNLNQIANISDNLKKIFLSKDYVNAVKQFANEFGTQAIINNKLIKAGFGAVETPIASTAYIEIAKKAAIESLVGAPIDKEFIKPIQGLLESAVVNGATFAETIESIGQFVNGDSENVSKIAKYAKQITNDSFSIADRSYTSIVSEALDNDWYYFSGSEKESTRCFCAERVGNYYNYREIESWGDGKNLGDCDLGGGEWAGEIAGTNSVTIYTYLGGYNCMHSLIPVSEFSVPDSDIARAKKLGFIK